MRIEYVAGTEKRGKMTYLALTDKICCEECDKSVLIVIRPDEHTGLPTAYLAESETIFDGDRMHDYQKECLHEIHFCPFCGEKIEIIIHLDENLDDNFLDLVQQVRDYETSMNVFAYSRQQRREKEEEINNIILQLTELVKQNKYLKEVNVNE